MPLHPYTHTHSGPLKTTPENSCIGSPTGPTDSVDSVSIHLPFFPCTLWPAPENSHIGAPQVPLMTRDWAWHSCSSVVLWGVALASPAHRFMHFPCEPGNCLVLLMKAKLMNNSRQKVSTAGLDPDPVLSCTKMCERNASIVLAVS